MLVRHDADLGLVGRDAQHGADEVRAVGRIDPGGAQDGVARVRGRDRPLAAELAAPVDAERPDGVVLDIGGRFAPSNT